MPWYPSAHDVLQLHNELVTLFASDDNPISPPGVRDAGLLESACARPRTALGGTEKYRTVFQRAAALFHSLVKNHAFHNGNKRTALATLVTFLWRNDYRINPGVTDDEVFDMVVSVANNSFPAGHTGAASDEVVANLAHWFRERTSGLGVDPPDMRVSDFLQRCSDAGARWKLSGSSYVVMRDRTHALRFSRSTTRLPGAVVREYLNRLGLSDVRVNEFQEGLRTDQAEVRRFRGVMRRLAHA